MLVRRKRTRRRHRGGKVRGLFVLIVILAALVMIYRSEGSKKQSQTASKPAPASESSSTLLSTLSSMFSLIPAPDSAREPPPDAKPKAVLPAVPQLLAKNEIRVHFIDLGQADAILLQSGENAALIDGGEYKTRETLIKYLQDAGVTTLDYVVATHPHSDHIGGLAPVIRQFEVKNVVMPEATNNTAAFEHLLDAIEEKKLQITVPSVGDKLKAGIIELTVLAPAKDFKDLNNASIVVRMAHGKTSVLLTGDAETPSEAEMLKSGLTLHSDVLKAGHHGSRTSTSAEFLDAVRPGTVVVMCGQGNSYKHPHKEFLDLVSQPGRNITLLRTDELGTIILTTDGQEIKIYITDREKSKSSA